MRSLCDHMQKTILTFALKLQYGDFNCRFSQIYENQTKFPIYLDIAARIYSSDHFHYANIDHAYELDSTAPDEFPKHSPYFLCSVL